MVDGYDLLPLESLKSLTDGGELDSGVISKYMEHLNRTFPDALCFSTYFWEKYEKDCARIRLEFEMFQNQKPNGMKKKMIKFYNCLLFPIYVDLILGGGHWFLVAAYPRSRKFFIIDSVAWEHQDYYKAVLKRIP